MVVDGERLEEPETEIVSLVEVGDGEEGTELIAGLMYTVQSYHRRQQSV